MSSLFRGYHHQQQPTEVFQLTRGASWETQNTLHTLRPQHPPHKQIPSTIDNEPNPPISIPYHIFLPHNPHPHMTVTQHPRSNSSCQQSQIQLPKHMRIKPDHPHTASSIVCRARQAPPHPRLPLHKSRREEWWEGTQDEGGHVS